LRHSGEACTHEPECGLAWSMRARLYSLNYSLELFDIETPLEKAAAFAERGVKLDPANQRVRMTMAFILLFKNERSTGLAEVDRALQLNPNSLIILENLGYLMTLFGDWQRGPVLINQAIEQNPYYNITVHYALCVDWIRQEEYEKAYEETLLFNRPLLFWDPLLKAANLGLLGRIEEGVQAGKDLLKCKPDFLTRGRMLIRHYIKFDDIVDRVVLGLRKAGIDVLISNKCFIHRPAVTIPSHCSYSHLTTGMQEDAVWPGGMIDKTLVRYKHSSWEVCPTTT
jgi:adenylate cyclase